PVDAITVLGSEVRDADGNGVPGRLRKGCGGKAGDADEQDKDPWEQCILHVHTFSWPHRAKHGSALLGFPYTATGAERLSLIAIVIYPDLEAEYSAERIRNSVGGALRATRYPPPRKHSVNRSCRTSGCAPAHRPCAAPRWR